MDSALDGDNVISDDSGSSHIDSEALLESEGNCFGPSKIIVHWYCREIGLASYVWNSFLRKHVNESWEKNSECKGKLQLHIHLTASNAVTGGEEILGTISDKGLVKKQTYPIDPVIVRSVVQDAHFTQSLWLGLLLPGSLIIGGTILHWWWYKDFIVNKKYSHDNLVIRTHSIIFALVFALAVSFMVEKCLHYCANKEAQTQRNTSSHCVDVEATSSDTDESSNASGDTELHCGSSVSEGDPSLIVSGGRPPIDDVIHDIIDSNKPGVYSCGPRPLMNSVENAIRNSTCSTCAFYREDSEM